MVSEKEDHTSKCCSIKSVLKVMAQNSSVHGIPKIMTAKYAITKVMWLVVLLITTGFTCYQLRNLYITFSLLPVSTNVNLKFHKLQFPAVSFCNMNPIKKSKLFEASDAISNVLSGKGRPKDAFAEDLLKPSENIKENQINDTLPIEMPNSTTAAEQASTIALTPKVSVVDNYNSTDNDTFTDVPGSEEQDMTTTLAPKMPAPGSSESAEEGNVWDTLYAGSDEQYIPEFSTIDLDEQLYGTRDKWMKRIEDFKTVFSEQTKENRFDLGHKIEDMLLACTFGTKKCYPQNFTLFQTADYGNCYTIQSHQFVTRRTGPLYGLWLTLNIESAEYITNFATGFGIKLVIHEPGSFPFPSEEGITLSPNQETNIALRMLNVSRMEPPYGHCQKTKDFYDLFGIHYTLPACMRLCKYHLIMEKCKCIPVDIDNDIEGMIHEEYDDYEYNEQHGDDDRMYTYSPRLKTCNERSQRYQKCRGDIELSYSDGQGCDCESPCKEVVYQKTISGRVWPNDDYLVNALVREICGKKNLSYAQNTCSKYKQRLLKNIFDMREFDKSFLRLIIYYEDLNYEYITEKPLYDGFRFLSDIGGTLGLFMGASILSLFEVVQLLLEVVYYILQKKRISENGLTKKDKS